MASFGVLILYLPIGLASGATRFAGRRCGSFFFLVVALMGTMNIGVWFGWYLLVSLAFAGHNDEAAGAARVEKYKQFIRFRLTPDTLTGYVIAIDEPGTNGRELKRELWMFSVFTLDRRSGLISLTFEIYRHNVCSLTKASVIL